MPIDGADNIELAHILGWRCVVKKGEFNEGDLCVYFEIDSLLPEKQWSEFMRNKKFKVKTMKFNKFGVISQGLALPINIFPELKEKISITVGMDVTELLEVVHIPDESISKGIALMPNHRNGVSALVDFPTNFPFVNKTDLERIENRLIFLKTKDYITVTEKLDGTSASFILEKVKRFLLPPKYILHVCSKNKEILFDTGDVYWEMKKKYPIKQALKDLMKYFNANYICIQGEIIGEGVQKNPLKREGRELYVYNMCHSNNPSVPIDVAKDALLHYGIKWVPILNMKRVLNNKNIEDIKKEADGNSLINPNVKREGVVYHNPTLRIKAKNVSNAYLLEK